MGYTYFDDLGLIVSSPNDINSFMQSSVYVDYLYELEIRISETIGLLEDDMSQYTGRDYDKFRGRLKNLKEMKDLFINMHEAKLDEMTKEEEKEDDS